MLTKLRAKVKDSKGFTLIELMIVVAILGILAAVAIPYYNQYIKNSKIRIAKSNYEAGVRTVKTEFANKTAGNTPAPSIIALLNDNVGGGAAKNKDPFDPTLDAFLTGGGGAGGQVDVTPDTVPALGAAITISSTIDGVAYTQTLTFQ